MKKWRCIVCNYVHQGWKPPSHCPICGVQANMFEEVEDTEPASRSQQSAVNSKQQED